MHSAPTRCPHLRHQVSPALPLGETLQILVGMLQGSPLWQARPWTPLTITTYTTPEWPRHLTACSLLVDCDAW